jgi:hypothetical protein
MKLNADKWNSRQKGRKGRAVHERYIHIGMEEGVQTDNGAGTIAAKQVYRLTLRPCRHVEQQSETSAAGRRCKNCFSRSEEPE